jgi:misacylated tRNA(Ala) deacylase
MTITDELFRRDGYLKECNAVVVAAHDGVIVTDQTVFYPEGGGQPGDTGSIMHADGREFVVTDTQKDAETGEQQHRVATDFDLPAVGETVTLKLDWERRYRLMRMHSCMHMLCAAIPAPVTGGSIQDGRGRLDFDLPDPVDKEEVTDRLNALVVQDSSMQMRWISAEELAHKPELVRTMSVKPPTGSGQVRIVEFEGIDLQPCGGTHVASTGEIGRIRVRKIEKKGRQNRRVIVVFDD